MKIFTKKITLLYVIGMLFSGTMLGQVPFFTETFTDSIPADWTAVEAAGDSLLASNWTWTESGPAGAFAVNPLNSATAADGWMIFDSDLNCSGEQDVWLVSPKIDMSDKALVQMQFDNLYARYGDTVTVEVSTDSTNWTAFPIMSGTENNTFGDGSPVASGSPINPLLIQLDISSVAANQPEVWFAFHFYADSTNAVPMQMPGCGYSWQVDDVALFDEAVIPEIDLAIGDFFYTPASYAQPVSQVASDTFGFFADVANNGATDAYDATLRARVFDTDGTTVLYETSVNVDTVFVDSVTTVDIPGSWAPEVDQGVYSLAYDLFIDGETDPTPGDNAVSRNWEVTSDVWSKDIQASIGYRPGGGPQPWLIGNLYTTGANMVEEYEAHLATFEALKNAADGNLAGDIVEIVLLEVDDTQVDPAWNTFDDSADFIDNDGLIIKSLNIHTFTTNNTQGEESTELRDFDDDDIVGIKLKPATRYFLCANYQEEGSTSIFHGFNESINYFQISTVVYTDSWFLGGFGPEPAASLRMRIRVATSDANERTLDDSVLNFYPNPATDNLNVALTFDKVEPAVNITLAQLNGEVIMIDELTNISEANQQYNISDLPAGTYIVRVATEEGTKTKKFIKVR